MKWHFHTWIVISRLPYERGWPYTSIKEKCVKCGKERRKMVGPGR